MDPAVVTRFAPSPTGDLHPGNARTALFSFLLARSQGGRFVLRVEDTDRERGSDEFIAAQIADLAWLDLPWDAGPGRDDGRGPYRQSERGAPLCRILRAARARGPCLSVLLHAGRARCRAPAAAGGGRGAALPGHLQKSQRIRACGAHASRAPGCAALCDPGAPDDPVRRHRARPAVGGGGIARRFRRAPHRRRRRVLLLQCRG